MIKKLIKVQCPHCKELVVPVRKSRARWVGGVVGAGLGAKVGGGLGIAGLGSAIAGIWPVGVIGLGFGYLLAEKAFTKSRCSKCNGKLS